jgi:MYXO-CTERM domain-containing protein
MRLKHVIGGGAVGLATVSMLTVGALSAAAAPVTDPLGPGASGTTAHGVDWSSSRAITTSGSVTNGFALNSGDSATLRFGEPVDLTFDVVSLQSSGPTDSECVTLPAGIVLVQRSSLHVWDAATRTVCSAPSNAVNNPGAETATSQFRMDGVSSFTTSAAGTNTTRGRGISDLRVTVDREEALLVDDSDSTTMGTPVTVGIDTNDTIPAGSTGWNVDTTTARGGTVVDNGDGSVTYTPPAGFTGTDTFTYRVTGPDGVEHEATVTITVTEEEEPPVPMISPAFALAGLAGTGLLAAVRRRRA